MPSNLPELLLLVVLLLPGVAYHVSLERRGLPRRTTALRESAAVLFTSLITEIVTVATTWPLWSRSICFDKFVRDPKAYAHEYPTEVVWWALALLTSSAAIACAMGQLRGRHAPIRVSRFIKRSPTWFRGLTWPPRWVWRQLTYVHPSGSSAWWVLLDAKPQSDKHVSIHLSDGSLVRGIVRYYNSDPNETGDREIILRAPIEYRAPKGKTMTDDYGANFVTISACQIVSMFVTYVPKKKKGS